jgi:transcriptional regulator with XRE-family HTH domain
MRVKLAEIRGKRRLEDIAEELGVAISTVQRWEAQTISIPSERLPAIAAAYRCKIVDIFEEGAESAPRMPAEVVQIWTRMPLDQQARAVRVLRAIADEESEASK